MCVCLYKVLSLPVKIIISICKLVICVIFYIIVIANQIVGVSFSPRCLLAENIVQKSEKTSRVETGEPETNRCPTTTGLTTEMAQSNTHSNCVPLTNNCLFFIHYHSKSGTQDAIADIVKKFYNDEEINIAYVSIREVVPESERRERTSKSITNQKKVNDMFLWLDMDLNIHIIPDNPYALPPFKPDDLSLVSVHSVATKALESSQLKSSEVTKLIPGLSDDLSAMKSQIDEMKNQHDYLLDSLKKLHILNNQLVSNPDLLGTLKHPQPPTTTPTTTSVSNFPLSLGESTEGEQDNSNIPQSPPSTSYSEALKLDTLADNDGWQTVQSRKKRDKPIFNQPINHQFKSDNNSNQRRFVKRCHVVIHNLHYSVTEADIRKRVIELTGSEPLLLHEVKCNARGQVAFRVTCLFEYLEKLAGENFGPSIKVSFYHLNRDRKKSDAPCVLGPLPSRCPAVQPQGHSPSADEISELINTNRDRSNSLS